MRQGKPVVVHGDGTSLWTLTHHEDFARGFVPLLGHPRALGEAFHITSDDVLTWNQITTRSPPRPGSRPQIVHVPSDAIAAGDPELGRRAARRQGPLDGLRQQQAARPRPRRSRRGSRSSREPGRSSTGTTRTPPARSSTQELDAALDRLVATWDSRSR